MGEPEHGDYLQEKWEHEGQSVGETQLLIILVYSIQD